jgi:hypothetical protein
MSDNGHPKALFISPDGNIYPDNLICSGALPAELKGQACPFAQAGRLPDLRPLQADDPGYSPDKGNPLDLCPPCVKHQLASLEHWRGHGGNHFPAELLPLRLFKCNQWFWLVIPGLYDADATKIAPNGNGRH